MSITNILLNIMKQNYAKLREFETVSCCICGKRKSRLFLKTQGFRIVQCEQCHLVYVNPRLSKQRLKKLYDREYFTNRETRYFEETWRTKVFEPIVNELTKITKIKYPNLLDVGTATGYFLKSCRERGFIVRGVEPSSKASGFARDHLHLPVKTGNLLSTRFPVSSFDIITMNDVIEHTPDPRKELVQAHKLLKPNGWIVLSTPNIDSLGFKAFKEGFAFIAPEVHLWYFTPETLSKLLVETGYTVKKITFPYFDTPFFNLSELLRLGIGLTKRLLLPSQIVPSAPWYGNVLKIYAQKT